MSCKNSTENSTTMPWNCLYVTSERLANSKLMLLQVLARSEGNIFIIYWVGNQEKMLKILAFKACGILSAPAYTWSSGAVSQTPLGSKFNFMKVRLLCPPFECHVFDHHIFLQIHQRPCCRYVSNMLWWYNWSIRSYIMRHYRKVWIQKSKRLHETVPKRSGPPEHAICRSWIALNQHSTHAQPPHNIKRKHLITRSAKQHSQASYSIFYCQPGLWSVFNSTHWDRNKMADILQTTFGNVCIYLFLMKCSDKNLTENIPVSSVDKSNRWFR